MLSKNFKDKFINHLKELRTENNLSQNDLAKVLNVTRATYGHYETGRRIISIEDLCKLADFYKVSVDYILGRED